MKGAKSHTTIGLMGSPQVGKTNLALRMTMKPEEFNIHFAKEKYKESFGEEYVGNGLRIIEMGGNSTLEARKRSIYYRVNTMSMVIVCFSMDQKESIEDLVKNLVPEVKKECLFQTPILLVLTKSDLIPENVVDQVEEKISTFVKEKGLKGNLKLSVKTGEGYKQFEKIIKGVKLPKRPPKQSAQVRAEVKRREENVLVKEEGNELIFYSFHGDVPRVRQMISEGCNTNMKSFTGWTAFSAAVVNQQMDMVIELLKHPEVKVNDFSIEGETPVTFAGKHGYTEMMELLLRTKRIDIYRENNLCRKVSEVITNEETKEVYEYVKELQEKFFSCIQEGDAEEMKVVLKDIHINCQNQNGENGLEIALKNKKEDIIEFLMESKIRVEKDMAKLDQEKRDVLYKTYAWQVIRSVFTELLAGEKRYLEKLFFLNKFYLLPMRKNIKKIVKKAKRRKEIIEYCDLIFDLKKESYELVQVFMTIFTDDTDKKEEAKYLEAINRLMKVDFRVYLKFFQLEAMLNSEIKEDAVFVDLYKFLVEQKLKIKVKRERTQGFFLYTLNIKDRIMAYQNLLSRILKVLSGDKENLLYQTVSATLKFIIKSIREFDDKVKNESHMKKITEILKKRWKMASITQNKKRKYVHHEIDLQSLRITEDERKPHVVKKYSIFLFSDLIVVGEKKLLTMFFLHDTKSVFYFNGDHVAVKIYHYETQKIIFNALFMCRTVKIMDWIRNMHDFYYERFDHYYFPKILILSNLKVQDDIDEFLNMDKRKVMEIVQYKRDLLNKQKDIIVEKMGKLEEEDENYIDEIKRLREKMKDQNQLQVDATQMLKKYNKDRSNVQSSPLVIKVK